MKGICFIESLFIKVVSGEKTQTRRIAIDSNINLSLTEREKLLAKARYRVGETIYLKEPYCDDLLIEDIIYKYKTSDTGFDLNFNAFKNKLFMPSSAARYFIKITKVGLERLQRISDEDCIKEGIKRISGYNYRNTLDTINRKSFRTPQEAYSDLIDSINGIGTWDNNPYVYVYDFELIKD